MGTIASVGILISEAPSASFNAPNSPSYKTTHAKMPVAWTAADLKMQFSDDGGTTWYDVLESDGTVSIITGIPTTGGGLIIEPLDPNSGIGKWSQAMKAIPNALFRVVSVNTAGGADLVQAAARTIDLITAN